MINKLEQLIDEWEALTADCPDHITDYELSKESKMVRIIKKRINPIYNECINGVYERHALKIELKTGATKPELVIDENYSDD